MQDSVSCRGAQHRRIQLVCRALCLCSAVFVLLQLLLAQSSGLSSGSGGGDGHGDMIDAVSDSRHQRLLLLVQSASGHRVLPEVRNVAQHIDVEESRQHRRRVVECLAALDAELRLLAVQPIATVEEFQKGFLDQRVASGLADLNDDEAERRLKPPCRKKAVSNPWEDETENSAGTQLPPSNAKQPIFLSPGFQQPQLGGRHRPSNCQPSSSCVLLLIPYRHRMAHLRVLLRHLHPMMQAQQLCYTIVVAEQYGNATFNKAKLMNAAFLESVKLGRFDCVIFHDVDLIPANRRIPYACPAYPRHNSVSIDKFGYNLPYKQLVGGVLAMPIRHFLRVNGYSNLFWGWGGEDDDMETRIRSVGLLVTRPHPRLARYRMIRHEASKEILGEVRYKLLHLSSKRYRLDGLNSLNYSLVSKNLRPLFTHIVIDIGDPPPSSRYY